MRTPRKLALFLVSWSVVACSEAVTDPEVPEVNFAMAVDEDSRVVFTSNEDESYDIFMLSPFSIGLPENITITPGVDESFPALSPDRSQIAYVAGGDLWVRGVADTAQPVQYTSTPEIETHPAWSPDGTQLAFVRDGDVYVAKVALPFVAYNLTKHPSLDGDPSWSPDGNLIAFASNRSGGHGFSIYVMKIKTRAAGRITDTAGDDRYPDWSPDGMRIVFSTDRSGREDVYWVSRSGGVLHSLTNDPAVDRDPTWSPDGTKIAFVSYRSGGTGDLWWMNADGTNQSGLRQGLATYAHPDWR